MTSLIAVPFGLEVVVIAREAQLVCHLIIRMNGSHRIVSIRDL
jgi:hypothetical protein